ncbi:MAG: hypothetical protein CL610_06620 [Anaerolineaceae bacterium]|nr:hypothetical protein [Anaerolineaceae bacterium]
MSQNVLNHRKQQIDAPFRVKSAGVSLVVILAIGSYFIANLLTLLTSEQAVPDGALSLTIITITLIAVVEATLQIVLFIGAGRVEEQSKLDKDIANMASRNAYRVLMAGTFATFASMFAGFTPFEMGSLLMGAFLLAEIVKFASQIVYYRQAA